VGPTVGADVELAAFVVEALGHFGHAGFGFGSRGLDGGPSTILRMVPLPVPGRI
jgi:hypothetical protein